jgi:flagellar biogenesis protein FliO
MNSTIRILLSLSLISLISLADHNRCYGEDKLQEKLDKVIALAEEQGKNIDMRDLREKKDEERGYMVKMLQGLGLCVGVLLIGLFFVKRFNPNIIKASTKNLRLLEKISISAKSSLVLAELDGKKFIVAVGGDNLAFYDPKTFQDLNLISEEVNLPHKEVAS